MARRTLALKHIRALTRLGTTSTAVTIPIDIMRNLKWRKGQKVTVRQSGNKLIIEDWKG